MTSPERLWLLWQMNAGIGRPRRFTEKHEPGLFAEDVIRLRETPGITSVELIRLEPATDLHPRWFDWMLVIDLDQPEAQDSVAALFDDLRSAGARPMLLRQAAMSGYEKSPA